MIGRAPFGFRSLTALVAASGWGRGFVTQPVEQLK
jgi:hypothetical protein